MEESRVIVSSYLVGQHQAFFIAQPAASKLRNTIKNASNHVLLSNIFWRSKFL